MDQVKAALVWLKEHHFWVLSVAVIGAVVGVWYTGSTSLASQFASNKSKIESEFSSLEGIRRQPFIPNDKINGEQAKQTAALADDVLKEWRELYNNQVKEVLIWPKELPERFRNDVAKKQFGDPIEGSRLELYHAYIKESFKPLVAIVDAEPLEEGATGGGFGGPRGRRGGGDFGEGVGEDGEPLQTYLVDWVGEDQGRVRQRLEIDKTPSGLQIWVLQEDLWVYETLLRAIAKTNEASGATRRDRAAVQTIMELTVGQSAAGYDASSGRLQPPDANEVAAAPGGFGGGEFGGGYGDFGGGGGEFGGGGGEFGGGYGDFGGGRFGGGGGVDLSGVGDDASAILLAGRYLDDAGQPIMEVTPGDFSFGREFKRLPVRLTLEMDTRYLTNLMWELANAPLQVEVEQVRFNPEGSAAGGGGFRRRGGGGTGNFEAFNRRPTVGTVILQGIVYVFNRPDESIAAAEDSFE